jgi:tetratricopeptide (TPR) repeat protein
MTRPTESNWPGGFTLCLLPWILGGVMLAAYLLTFNHWISVGNVDTVMQLNGWSWRAELTGPLYFLVTYPLRWLPVSLVPLALNTFTAVCGALTLVLLARSVALLPHDRTQSQRQRETSPFALLTIPTAWVPPALAVIVCGFQITFWQYASQGTDETFNLLIFAYLVRCLLEFRIGHRASWMNRFALIYGLSIAQNWAMAAFIPCFLAAVIWINGLRLFNPKFLLRCFCLWFGGLSLILLLPILASLSNTTHTPFWQGLRATIAEFRNLGSFSRNELLLLCLPSIIPLFLIGIRWPSSFGDTSPLGIIIATAAFHLVHAVFLLAGVWVALNVRISPRQINPQYYNFSFLPISYLTTLGVGYFSGYLLLVFRNRAGTSRQQLPPLAQTLNQSVTACIWALLPVAATLLLARNLPTILNLRSGLLPAYCAQIEHYLPEKDAVILSDDSYRLRLLEALLDQHGKRTASLLIDTGSLPDPNYFTFLNRLYPQFQLSSLFTNAAAELRTLGGEITLLQKLSAGHSMYYLQPSFGNFFEFFYLEPHGPVYRMMPMPVDGKIPPLSQECLTENDSFWKTAEQQFGPIIQANAKAKAGPPIHPTLLQKFEKLAHLKNDRDLIADIVGHYYSRAVNDWGTRLQQIGSFKGAEDCFKQAWELNPNNVTAQINLEFNQNYQAGKPPVLLDIAAMEERIGNHRKWDRLISDCGPVDDPNYCYQLAAFDLQAELPLLHQALHQLERVQALAPGVFAFAKMTIVQLLLYTHNFSDALAKTDAILHDTRSDAVRADVFRLLIVNQQYSNALQRTEEILQKTPTNATALFYKGAALLRSHSTNEALLCLRQLMEAHPDDETHSQVFQLLAGSQLYSNVVEMADVVLKQSPDDQVALFFKGVVLQQLQSYRDSLGPFTRLLQVQPDNYVAQLNRAIAQFKLDDLDSARRDYGAVAAAHTNVFQAYYGLAEIAYRLKDFPEALKNYQLYVTCAPTNTDESRFVNSRIQELEGARPGKH